MHDEGVPEAGTSHELSVNSEGVVGGGVSIIDLAFFLHPAGVDDIPISLDGWGLDTEPGSEVHLGVGVREGELGLGQVDSVHLPEGCGGAALSLGDDAHVLAVQAVLHVVGELKTLAGHEHDVGAKPG